MGKQSKRKGGKRKSGQHHRPTGLADDAAADTAGNGDSGEGPVANVVKKIRHGDPRVRHAALVALSSTLYDSNSLSSAAKNAANGKQRKDSAAASANNPTLLRALAERMLDPDVPCATTAAGCLSNYVGFYTTSVSSITGGGDNAEVNVASEVMVPILLQRVQKSLEVVHALGGQIVESVANAKAAVASSAAVSASNNKNSSSNATEKLWLSSKEQWSLLSLTLQTLAGLIENCPMAVQRMSGGFASSTTNNNIFVFLLHVLSLSGTSLKVLDEGNVVAQQQLQYEKEPILDAATNAARALHSLLDDNSSLIASIPVHAAPSNAAATTIFAAMEELKNTVTNTQFSDITRLHASGAILSLRKVLVIDKEMSGSSNLNKEEQQIQLALQSCTSDVVLPMLHALFDVKFENNESSSNPKIIVQRIMDLSNQISTQKRDEEMESQIAHDIKQRKEPARSIARRQKEMKKDRETQKQQEKEGQVETMEEDNTVSKESKPVQEGGAMIVEADGEEKDKQDIKVEDTPAGDLKDELDGVVQSWRDLMGSYKLALELTANLCAGKEDDDEDDGMMYGGGEDDEHMWDSDDEEKLVAAVNSESAHSSDTGSTPSEQAIFVSMASINLPEQILCFFRKWVEFLPSGDTEYPGLVVDDVNELLSTCALCLGNAIACDLHTWSAPAMKSLVMVGSHANAVENGVQLFWWELVSIFSLPCMTSIDNHAAKPHVTLTMLSMLRHQPLVRTLVDSTRLDLILSFLSIQPKKTIGKVDSAVQVLSNAIAMLGVLCSEPHPATIDSRVCNALLECLRSATSNESDMASSIIVIHDILNVLMDMYGGDDCHDDIFAQNDVMGHFKRCLPGFKRQIKKLSASRNSREEVETWSETALNASRFIKYKGG